MLAAFMGAAMRIVGGWLSDRFGGINTLTAVLLAVATALGCCALATGSLAMTTVLLIACFAALGAGNGAVYQLVPLRWPLTTAVAGSMIGELGALGGGLVPSTMGLARQYLGTYAWGFASFAACSLGTLVLLRTLQSSWTGRWVGAGGRAHGTASARSRAMPRRRPRRLRHVRLSTAPTRPEPKDIAMKKMKLVMIGNGMAGVRTLEELLKIAPDLYDITVFGAEPHPNYNRILLSPVLAGEQTLDEIVLNAASWYAEQRHHAAPGQDGHAHRPRPARGRSPATAPQRRTTACCSPPARTRSSCRSRARTCRA